MEQDILKGLPPGMMPVFKGSILFAYLIIGIIYALYIRNLFRLMSLVRPANRRMNPSMILLLAVNILSVVTIVPLFNAELALRYKYVIDAIQIGTMMFVLIFTFYMVNKISESLDAELKSRNVTNDPKPTLKLGMFMCICNTATLLVGVGYLAVFGLIASVMGLVAWVMYWMKTREYIIKLESMPPTNSLNDLGIF